MFYHNTEFYTGDWFDNKREGYGEYYYKNGERYKGEWKNHLKHGYGTLYNADWSSYEGEFFLNKKHGKGRFKDGLGFEYDEEWKKGIFIKRRSINKNTKNELSKINSNANSKNLSLENSKSEEIYDTNIINALLTKNSINKANTEDICEDIDVKQIKNSHQLNTKGKKTPESVPYEPVNQRIQTAKLIGKNEEKKNLRSLSPRKLNQSNSPTLNPKFLGQGCNSDLESLALPRLTINEETEDVGISETNSRMRYDSLSLMNFRDLLNSFEDILDEKQVANWTIEEIVEVLKRLGLPEKVQKSFSDNQITGKTFVKMNENDIKDLGITIKGHIIIIREAVEK